MELDAIRNLTIREGLQTLTCGESAKVNRREVRTRLGVPELHLSVERGTEELCAVAVEVDVAHGASVAHERAQTLALVVDVPQLLGR